MPAWLQPTDGYCFWARHIGLSVCPWVSPSVRGSVRLSVGLFVSTDDSVPNPGAGILDVPRTADSVLVSCEEDGPRELH